MAQIVVELQRIEASLELQGKTVVRKEESTSVSKPPKVRKESRRDESPKLNTDLLHRDLDEESLEEFEEWARRSGLFPSRR